MPARILQQLLRSEHVQVRPAEYLAESAYALDSIPDVARYVDLTYSSAFGHGVRLSWNEASSFGTIEAARFHAGFSFLMLEAELSNCRTATRYGDGCIVVQFFPRKTLIAGAAAGSDRAIPLPACRLTRYAPGTARTQRLCSPTRLSHVGIVLEATTLMSIIGMSDADLPENMQQLCAAPEHGDQIIDLPLTADLCSSIGMLMNYDGTGAARATYLYAKLLGILVEVVRIGKRWEKIRCARYGLTERDEQLVRRARELILSSLSQELTLEAIARRIGTNRTKLGHGFRMLFGSTVADFVREARLSQALVRLQSGSASVAQVANECGYADTTTFGRAFKKRYGMSPGATRSSARPPASSSSRLAAAPGR